MISEFIESLLIAKTYSDDQFAAFLLKADPLIAKMNDDQQHEVISGALRCGNKVATELVDKYGEQQPFKLAEIMQAKIVRAYLPSSRTVISTYDPRMRTITLNQAMLDVFEQSVNDLILANLPGIDKMAEFAVAHELFHHIEAGNQELFTRHHQIVLWRVGPVCNRSTVPMASEIAAAAFAKDLCRLRFNPTLLDVILLHATDPKRTEQWFDSLRSAVHHGETV